jgi:hypothetical protein
MSQSGPKRGFVSRAERQMKLPRHQTPQVKNLPQLAERYQCPEVDADLPRPRKQLQVRTFPSSPLQLVRYKPELPIGRMQFNSSIPLFAFKGFDYQVLRNYLVLAE